MKNQKKLYSLSKGITPQNSMEGPPGRPEGSPCVAYLGTGVYKGDTCKVCGGSGKKPS